MTDLQSKLASTLSGTYTIERELGGGGMSRVFVAEELRLGRKVVVKVLSPDLAAAISVERFEREMRLAASLQQANIVPVLAAGEIGGLPYYTMPFVDGESLRARLTESAPLPAADAVRILIDVARALQYAHERGVVHRDIKPDNVLLSGATAVVTDFGIAKAIAASRGNRPERAESARDPSESALTLLGTSIGTPAYMAPEQAAGDPNVDHRADLYAFGCMAYEMLAGDPPFHGRTPQRVLAAHMSEAPLSIGERRPDLPPALSALIMDCLAKDPGERPQSATEILGRLESVTSGGSLPAMPAVLLHGPAAFWKAILVYALSVVFVAGIARAATPAVGLPDWVFPASLMVMALGLPVILFTGYVQRIAYRTVTTTPRLTPGGGTATHGTFATIALKASPHLSWKRATTGGFAAVGVLVVAVIGFLAMRALGIGPAASLFTSGRLKATDAIIVADFSTSRADSSIGTVAAEAVRASLGESPTIQLASTTTIVNTLRLMQKPPTARLDNAIARDIAIRRGYKAIVTGEVTGLGNGYVVALKLVTADSGAVLATYQTTVDGPKELVDGVDGIARKLRAKIGESLRSVQSNPPLVQVTTSSLDALRYEGIAIRLNSAGDYTAAAEAARQAVAADSTFAEGWRELAVTESNGGLPRSAVDSAIARAYQLRTKLPESEALDIAAFYYERGPGRDRVRAISAYQQRLGHPGGPARNNLSILYVERREFARAESLLRPMRPRGALGDNNLVAALVGAGRLAAAHAVLDSARKRYPTTPAYSRLLLDVVGTESPMLLHRVADSIASSGNRDVQRSAEAAGATADATLGRVLDAKRRTLGLARADAAAGRTVGLLRYGDFNVVLNPPAVSVALMDGIVRGDTAAAVRELDSAGAQLRWTTLAPVDRPYTPYALAYAQVHRPDKARALLVRMTAEVRDTSLLRTWQPMIHQTLGEIALDEHQPRVAMDESRKADSLPDGPANGDPLPILVNLGRAFDQANQSDSAIVYFERYLAAPSIYRAQDDAVYLAGVHRRLGELYEARHDNAKAIAHYNTLIQLWKSADPDLQPVVAEMRRRVTRLERAAGG